MRTENVVALLADNESGNILFAQNPKAPGDMNALLKKLFEQVAGKGGGTKDFSRGALADATNANAAMNLAKTLL